MLVSYTVSCVFDARFDDITEILDDSLPGPVSADNLSPLQPDHILDM